MSVLVPESGRERTNNKDLVFVCLFVFKKVVLENWDSEEVCKEELNWE